MADRKKKPAITSENPVETLKDMGGAVVRDVAEVPAAILDTALEQIGLKPQRKPLSGEINLLTGINKTNTQIERKEAQLDRKLQQLQSVNRQEQEIFNLKKRAVEEQIKRLMDELALEVKRLEVQTAELTSEVRAATVETVPARPGTYHLNFLDWVINSLRDLRKRVNHSRLWLESWTTKKKAKGYWAMFQKHGLNFAASGERAIAQAGG